MHTPLACADMIQVPVNKNDKTATLVGVTVCHWCGRRDLHAFLRLRETRRNKGIRQCAHLRETRRNKGIRQCAHWLMHTPLACADIIQVPIIG